MDRADPKGRPSGEHGSVDAAVRERGRTFLLALHTAMRSLRLYPLENEQAQRGIDELVSAAEALHREDDELEVRVSGEFFFINGTRLRLGVDNYQSFSNILNTFRYAGIGMLRVEQAISRRDWQVLVSELLKYAVAEQVVDGCTDLLERLQAEGVNHVELESPPEAQEDYGAEERAKEIAKRTYERSVAVTKEVVNSVRMGRSANAKKVKRAVQGIVDQVLTNETSIMGLTTIRDYDEYTFTHSVNVCTFSVAIAKRLGLSKLQLYDLGVAALLHDVGKSRVPLDVLNKTTGLDDTEWQLMRSHPWLGALTLFGLRGYGDIPFRGIIAAYEHHMKIDLTGYPRPIRPRELSLYSKIIAVADGFDAATTRRSYQTVPIQPDQVLREMFANPRRGYDRPLVKELINLLGIYPVGTCLILDSYEVAIVHSANPDAEQRSRPVVRVMVTADGERLDNGPLVDLSEKAADGTYRRSVVKVTDPAKYGINPSDSFV